MGSWTVIASCEISTEVIATWAKDIILERRGGAVVPLRCGGVGRLVADGSLDEMQEGFSLQQGMIKPSEQIDGRW